MGEEISEPSNSIVPVSGTSRRNPSFWEASFGQVRQLPFLGSRGLQNSAACLSIFCCKPWVLDGKIMSSCLSWKKEWPPLRYSGITAIGLSYDYHHLVVAIPGWGLNLNCLLRPQGGGEINAARPTRPTCPHPSHSP